MVGGKGVQKDEPPVILHIAIADDHHAAETFPFLLARSSTSLRKNYVHRYTTKITTTTPAADIASAKRESSW